jgi:hypothetical protein
MALYCNWLSSNEVAGWVNDRSAVRPDTQAEPAGPRVASRDELRWSRIRSLAFTNFLRVNARITGSHRRRP